MDTTQPGWIARNWRALICATTFLVVSWLLVDSALEPRITTNPASRYAAMEAIVDQGRWWIDETTLGMGTIDRVKWNGRFYSSKPPLLNTIGAGLYAGVQAFTGWTFRENRYEVSTAIRLLLAVFPWMFCVFAFARLTSRITQDPDIRLLGFVAFTAASLVTTWGGDFNNHVLAVACILGAALAVAPLFDERPDVSPPSGARLVVGGLLAGLATTMDLGATPVVGMAGLVVAWRLLRAGRHGALLAFVAFALIGPVSQLVLQWVIAGTWRPFYVVPEAYDYPGSYWKRPIEFDALKESRLVYMFHATLGHHGLVSLSPWLLPGVVGAFAWKRWSGPQRLERAALAFGVAFVLVYYLFNSNNYGGRGVGFRWWLVLHPVFALLAIEAIARQDLLRRRPLLLGAAIGIAGVTALTGIASPWEEGVVHAMFRAIGMGSVAG